MRSVLDGRPRMEDGNILLDLPSAVQIGIIYSTETPHRIGKKWITLGRQLSFRFARTAGIVTSSVLVGELFDVLHINSLHTTEGDT
jgi:hypothetical protein